MNHNFLNNSQWKSNYTVFDCHCEGDVEKVVTEGLPELPIGTVFEKMLFFRKNYDDIRLFFLHEPRGSMIQSVNFIVPTNHPDAVYGYIIAESEEYPVMSGGNTISVATVLLKSGLVPMTGEVTKFILESPAGLINIECDTKHGQVGPIKVTNKPAFVYCLDKIIDVPGFGSIKVDVAYGGMTYVLADASDFGVKLLPEEGQKLSELGQILKVATNSQISTQHPETPTISGVTQSLFAGGISRINGRIVSRNAVVVSPGRIDRCPCGTGTSARLAVLHAKKKITQGELFEHMSLIGTVFKSSIISKTSVGHFDAVITKIEGQAWITAVSNYVLEHDDPFPTGYKVSDTWPFK